MVYLPTGVEYVVILWINGHSVYNPFGLFAHRNAIPSGVLSRLAHLGTVRTHYEGSTIVRHWLSLIASMLFLVACSQPNSGATTNVAQPQAGKATVTARLFSTVTNQPISNTMIRLAPITRHPETNAPIFVLDEALSPGARTNNLGQVVIANVDPTEYVMIVSSDLGDNAVVTETEDTAKIWVLEAGKISDLGEIRVKWP